MLFATNSAKNRYKSSFVFNGNDRVKSRLPEKFSRKHVKNI